MGVTISVRSDAGHRPMEKSRASQRLVDAAVPAAEELGFALSDAATGGASDGNTTSAPAVRPSTASDRSAEARTAATSGSTWRASFHGSRCWRGDHQGMSEDVAWRFDELHPDAYRMLVEGVPAILYIDRPDELLDEPLHQSPDRVVARLLRGGMDGGPGAVEDLDPSRGPRSRLTRERGIQPECGAVRR